MAANDGCQFADSDYSIKVGLFTGLAPSVTLVS